MAYIQIHQLISSRMVRVLTEILTSDVSVLCKEKGILSPSFWTSLNIAV